MVVKTLPEKHIHSNHTTPLHSQGPCTNLWLKMSLEIIESFFSVHKCPGNRPQKIILSVFWVVKVCISLYVRYDARKNSDDICQDETYRDKIRKYLNYLKTGLYSEKIGAVYSNSNKFIRFVTARKHLWALLSDTAHLVFIVLAMGEQKTMPISSLVCYCLLIISDSISTFFITKEMVSVFDSKLGVLASGLLLRFIFGPLESFLELQYFGTQVDGYDKRHVVGLGIMIALFELIREVIDVRINFRLIKCFKDSEHTVVSHPTSSKVINCVKNASESKLREVLTIVNLTYFYSEVLKLIIYSLSLLRIISSNFDYAYDDWTDESVYEYEYEELVLTTQSTNHTEPVCEVITSLIDSFKVVIGDNHDDYNYQIVNPLIVVYVSVLVCMHYILVAFMLIIGKTFSTKQLMHSLFDLPVCIKRVFLLSFHMTIPNLCTVLLLSSVMNQILVVLTFVILYFISFLCALYSFVWFVHALYYTILYCSCVSARNTINKFSSYSVSIIELMGNTSSDTHVVENDSCCGVFSSMFYRKTITVITFIIFLLILLSNIFLFSINFSWHLPNILSDKTQIDVLYGLFVYSSFGYSDSPQLFTITQFVSAACGCLILCSILLSSIMNKACPSKRTPLHLLLCKSPNKNFNLCFVLPITPMGESVENDEIEIILGPTVLTTTNESYV